MLARTASLLQIGVPTEDGLMLASGKTVPTDGTAGYAHGCLFIHTDGTSHTDALYSNIGTVTSCNFNVVTVAAG
jgi:hypothetical protein